MSTLPKKLLKSCNKKIVKPSNKLGKKLLSHEVALSEIMPLIIELADTDEKKQQATERMLQLLAPKASSKRREALGFYLNSFGLGTLEPEESEEPVIDNPVDSPLRLIEIDHFASKPFKSTPCSSCPALKKGLCKCALKKAAREEGEH